MSGTGGTTAQQRTLLFFADISGFTRFVNETEITHSSHIISELIDVIIEQNNTGLELAEIEGDAVFFYRQEATTDIPALMEQCKAMFLAFHAHLKLYERDRICLCGACSTANQLTLKFVTHAGDVLVNTIRDRIQLMGKDVTTAHRLLKNDVPGDEYFMMSEQVGAMGAEERRPDWISLQQTSSTYESIGEVSYQYTTMTPLLKEVPELAERISKSRSRKHPIRYVTVVPRSIKEVHAKLIDLKIRPLWRAKIGYQTDEVERIGTVHDCILPSGSLNIEVVDQEIRGEDIIYQEQSESKGFLSPALNEVFTLSPIDDEHCRMSIEVHVLDAPVREIFLRPLFRLVQRISTKKFLALFEP